MNVLSLFDGMSCGQIALKELGIIVNKYYASEIDKYAIKQTQHNFPDTIHVGDVEKWREWDIDWTNINLVLAGSPCQGFSFAGKKLAFDDPRSKLFFVFIDILNHVRQVNDNVKFLLENVNMKREYMSVISEYTGIYPVRINSNLVSAQNRDRWYWTNTRIKEEGLLSELYSDIPQPKNKGILLRDILEKHVDEKFYLSDKIIKGLSNKPPGWDTFKPIEYPFSEKSRCVNSRQFKMGAQDTYIKIDKTGKPKKDQLKASCFTAGAHSGGNHSDMDLICVCMVGRKLDNRGKRKDNDKNLKAKQRLEPNLSGKTNCLTSVSKDNLIMQLGRGKNRGGLHQEKTPTLSSSSWEQNNLIIQLNPSKESGGMQPYQQNRVYADFGQMPALTAELGGRNNIYTDYRIRRLTPTECARLQTIPDWYKWIVSDTQIYKMCGNGWTVEVIMHILGYLKTE